MLLMYVLTNMNKHAWFVLVLFKIVSSLLAVFVIGRLLAACMCFLTRTTSYLESNILEACSCNTEVGV